MIDANAEAAYIRLFRNDLEATFVSRPNRFVILAESEGTTLRCHCPNPGRMEELLSPGCRLILERRSPRTGGGGTSAAPSTEWTAAAVYYRDSVVPLYSARANDAAAALVIPRLFPDAMKVEREVSIGRSRLDFVVTDADGTHHALEVKACSLVEYGTAMFPDAPSDRATRHIEELAELAAAGYRSHVLFVVLHGNPRRFVPNLHTDPAFASALAAAAPTLDIRAALLRADSDGTARLVSDSVPVDLSAALLAAENRGSYCIVLTLDEAATVEVGSLGGIDFVPGNYVYCGSARRNLAQRVARHVKRATKKTHWHLDYLTPSAARIDAYPIASARNLECDLARALEEAGGTPVPRFGSSDCRCVSHLFRFNLGTTAGRRILDVILEARHSWSLGLGRPETPGPELPG